MFIIPSRSGIITQPGLMLSLFLHMLVGPYIGELVTLSKSQVGVGQPCA